MKLITLLLLLCQIGFAQTNVIDTLWIEDFEDGNFDANVFTNAYNYNGTVQAGGWPNGGIYGSKSLVLDAGNGFSGKFNLHIKKIFSSISTYDKIVMSMRTGIFSLPDQQYPTVCSYTINWDCNPQREGGFGCQTIGPTPYTVKVQSGDASEGVNDIAICTSCSSFDYNGDMVIFMNGDGTTSNFDYAGFSYFYKNGNQQNYNSNNIYALKTSPNEIYTLKSDFCAACATNYGQWPQDFQAYSDCMNNAIVPNGVQDLPVKVDVKSLYFLGYRTELGTSTENATSLVHQTIYKVYDLNGKETTNPADSWNIVEYNDNTRKIVFFDALGHPTK